MKIKRSRYNFIVGFNQIMGYKNLSENKTPASVSPSLMWGAYRIATDRNSKEAVIKDILPPAENHERSWFSTPPACWWLRRRVIKKNVFILAGVKRNWTSVKSINSTPHDHYAITPIRDLFKKTRPPGWVGPLYFGYFFFLISIGN